MKILKKYPLFVLFFLFKINANSQNIEKYKFDRISNYKSQSNIENLYKQNEFTFYNSKDPNFYLHFHISNNNLIAGIILADAKKNKIFHFKEIKFEKEIDIEKVFTNPFGHKSSTDLNKLFLKNFTVKYDTLNSKKMIQVFAYKNKKLKKIKFEYSLEYVLDKPEVNQQISIPFITNLIWSNSILIPKNASILKFYYKNHITNNYESWVYKNTSTTELAITIQQ